MKAEFWYKKVTIWKNFSPTIKLRVLKSELQRVHIFSSLSWVQVWPVLSRVWVLHVSSRVRVLLGQDSSSSPAGSESKSECLWLESESESRLPRNGNFPALVQGIFHSDESF